MTLLRDGSACTGYGDPHQPHRFFRGAAIRTGDPGHRSGNGNLQSFCSPFRHGGGTGFADRAVDFQNFAGNLQNILFHLITVRNDAACKNTGCPRYSGDHFCYHPAGAGFRQPQRKISGRQSADTGLCLIFCITHSIPPQGFRNLPGGGNSFSLPGQEKTGTTRNGTIGPFRRTTGFPQTALDFQFAHAFHKKLHSPAGVVIGQFRENIVLKHGDQLMGRTRQQKNLQIPSAVRNREKQSRCAAVRIRQDFRTFRHIRLTVQTLGDRPGSVTAAVHAAETVRHIIIPDQGQTEKFRHRIPGNIILRRSQPAGQNQYIRFMHTGRQRIQQFDPGISGDQGTGHRSMNGKQTLPHFCKIGIHHCPPQQFCPGGNDRNIHKKPI